VDWAAKLLRELADRGFVVRGDAQDQLEFVTVREHLVDFSEFVKLILTVEDSLAHAVSHCELQVLLHLSRVGVDHLVFGKVTRQETELVTNFICDGVNLAHRGTVETAPETGQKLDDDWVRVALHGVEGLNHGELTHPLVVLFHNGRQVGDQE